MQCDLAYGNLTSRALRRTWTREGELLRWESSSTKASAAGEVVAALASGKTTIESRMRWALTLSSVSSGDRQINRWFVLLLVHLIGYHKPVEFIERDGVLAGGHRGDKMIIFWNKTYKDVGDKFWCFNGFANSS